MKYPPFSEATPELMRQVSEEIKAKRMSSKKVEKHYGWKHGDTVKVTLTTGEDLGMRILFVGHDKKLGESGIVLEAVGRCGTYQKPPKYKYLTKPLYKRTIELIREIYKTYTCGGALHIVLDDDNVEDDSIQWCIDNAINQNFENYHRNAESDNDIEEDRLMFLECANNLLKMPLRRRLVCIMEAINNMI